MTHPILSAQADAPFSMHRKQLASGGRHHNWRIEFFEMLSSVAWRGINEDTNENPRWSRVGDS
jgi:hypothetical protein